MAGWMRGRGSFMGVFNGELCEREPLRVCFRKLLTPSPPVSQFTYENKRPGLRIPKIEITRICLTHYSLSLYTLAYTLLRMSLRSHYSLSVLSLLLALHLCESSLGRWL